MSVMVQVVGGLLLTAAILGALAAIGKAAMYLFTVLRKLNRVLDDWLGEPPRAGLPEGRPGALDRIDRIERKQSNTADAVDEVRAKFESMALQLAALEAQMQPNGGASLRDAVDRVVEQTQVST